MKRIIAAILILSCVLGMTACSGSGNSKETINDYLVRQAIRVASYENGNLVADAVAMGGSFVEDYCSQLQIGGDPDSVSLFLDPSGTVKGYSTTNTMLIGSQQGAEQLATSSVLNNVLRFGYGYGMKLPKGFEGGAEVLLTYGEVTIAVYFEAMKEQQVLNYGVSVFLEDTKPTATGEETSYDTSMVQRAKSGKEPKFASPKLKKKKELLTDTATEAFTQIMSKCGSMSLYTEVEEILALGREAQSHAGATITSLTWYTDYVGDMISGAPAGRTDMQYLSLPKAYISMYGSDCVAYASLTQYAQISAAPVDDATSGIVVALLSDGTSLILSLAVDSNGFAQMNAVYDPMGDALADFVSQFRQSEAL